MKQLLLLYYMSYGTLLLLLKWFIQCRCEWLSTGHASLCRFGGRAGFQQGGMMGGRFGGGGGMGMGTGYGGGYGMDDGYGGV